MIFMIETPLRDFSFLFDYKGQYVTFPDFNDYKIISNNVDAKIAYKEAILQGIEDPILFYVE